MNFTSHQAKYFALEIERRSAIGIDRISQGLSSAKVETGNDYLKVEGLDPYQFISKPIKTYNDHHIAMCFALLSLGTKPVEILDSQCVNKTCPQFWDLWQQLT